MVTFRGTTTGSLPSVASIDVVLAAANRAAEWVGTDAFVKHGTTFVRLVGAEMAKHVNEAETAGFFVPASFEQDGKELSGAILTLDDRAVFAWTVGTFRVRNFEAVVPYASINAVERTIRPGGKLTDDLERLSIRAERDWNVLVPNGYDGGKDIVPLIADLLSGKPPPPVLSFAACTSKNEFVVAWAEEAFREAGRDPAEHVDGMELVSKTVRLRIYSYWGTHDEAYPELSKYLRGLKLEAAGAVLPDADELYRAGVRIVTDEEARKSGLARNDVEAQVIAQVDEALDKSVFRDVRAKIVGDIRSGNAYI